MPASIRIGRIFGIPIYLHITFIIIVPLFIWIFSAPQTQVAILGIPLTFKDLPADLWVKYLFGTLATAFFFLTILAHEVAHSHLAMKYGVEIKSITLMVFGGVSQMEEIPRKDGQEWRMAAAGPMTSLGIGAGSLVAWLGLKQIADPPIWLAGTVILLGLIAVYNLLLAGFNFIPAFPMDGGRVLRSLFAERMPFLEATRRAARIGRYFAIAMALFGIFYNFFLIIIALFVYIGATEEEQATAISETLHGVSVGQFMSTNVEVVHPDTTVQQLHDLMLSTRHMGFPVVDRGLVGIVTLEDTHKVSKEHLAYARVKDIMTRDVVTITPETDASKALKIMTERRINRLVILRGSDIVGIVTQKDILREVNILAMKSQTVRWGQQFEQPPLMPPV